MNDVKRETIVQTTRRSLPSKKITQCLRKFGQEDQSKHYGITIIVSYLYPVNRKHSVTNRGTSPSVYLNDTSFITSLRSYTVPRSLKHFRYVVTICNFPLYFDTTNTFHYYLSFIKIYQ